MFTSMLNFGQEIARAELVDWTCLDRDRQATTVKCVQWQDKTFDCNFGVFFTNEKTLDNMTKPLFVDTRQLRGWRRSRSLIHLCRRSVYRLLKSLLLGSLIKLEYNLRFGDVYLWLYTRDGAFYKLNGYKATGCFAYNCSVNKFALLLRETTMLQISR